jgi:hypothetical protein
VNDRDIDRTMRKVSDLRRVCLGFPHLPTPAEEKRLARFDALVLAPETATGADVRAIADGWRAWWRAQRCAEICEMVRRLPAGVVDGDRDVAMYAVAAQARLSE